MFVLKSNFDYDSKEYFVLTVDQNVLKIDYYQLLHTCEKNSNFSDTDYELISEKSIDLVNIFQPKTKFALYLNTFNAISDIFKMDDIYAARDGVSVLQTCYHISTKPVLVIYFDEIVDDILIISFKPTLISDVYIIRALDESTDETIKAFYPEYDKTAKIRSAKKHLIARLNLNESVAYMEAQLDFLTKAVLLMLNSLPQVKDEVTTQFPELLDFEAEFNRHNLFTVKETGKCLSEIKKTKALVRELQNDYYSIKLQNK